MEVRKMTMSPNHSMKQLFHCRLLAILLALKTNSKEVVEIRAD